ncbi:MAG: anthranilate synthase component I family protein [Aquisalinus sp.]|nr:anthranilate synthase component I family protein [Aquisalinus sp.]
MIVASPASVLSYRDNQLVWQGEPVHQSEGTPFDLLADIIKSRTSNSKQALSDRDMPPFVSGAFGHVSYEMGQFLEPSLSLPGADKAHMVFAIYDAVAAWPVSGGEGAIFGISDEAVDALRKTFEVSPKEASLRTQAEKESPDILSSRTQTDYQEQVQNCIQAILAGEIFQINLSRQLSASIESSRQVLPGAHQIFCSSAPAEFSCILQYPDETYLSFSPERFFKIEVKGNLRKVIAEPVKGTCRRSPDPEEDHQRAVELLASEKDRAENIMIADLVRNDLSRVCMDGTIVEEKICELQSNAHVHHLYSQITGCLREDKTAVDVLKSSFPCGSITGAPKVRAMQIIGDFEREPRGIYCGAIGYMDDRGNADFSVGIRTAEAKFAAHQATLTYGSGGGITVLSDPEKEWYETVAKSASFFEFLSQLGLRN